MICLLKDEDKYFTVAAEMLTGIYHYFFCAEFLNTYYALQSVVEGLAIASSNFVRAKRELLLDTQVSKEHQRLLLQG